MPDAPHIYVKHLAVEGFKSFPELSTLELLPGTCILVGDNGTGKTNIADALLWVLGESTLESLRASCDEDLIFAGSDELFPAGAARVTVVFDERPERTKGEGLPATICKHGHAGEHDAETPEGILTLTREIDRDGRETCSLNGMPSTDSEVASALADLGVAFPPVTTIRQGELERLLLLDPWSRRKEIERSAGIPDLVKAERRLLTRITELEGRLRHLYGEEREQARTKASLQEERTRLERYGLLEAKLRKVRAEMLRRATDESLTRADTETLFDALGLPLPDSGAQDDSPLRDQTTAALAEAAAEHAGELESLGPLNEHASGDLAAAEERLRTLATRKDVLRRALEEHTARLDAVRTRMEQAFDEALHRIDDRFRTYYELLAPGGEARLQKTDATPGGAAGLDVLVRPPGKVLDQITSLSGGERSLASLAFALARFQEYGSPFFVLDEVEPALDDTNIRRVQAVLDSVADTHQLLMISHQQRAKETGDVVFGVERNLDGASQVKYRYEPRTRDLRVFRRTWTAPHLRRHPEQGPSVTRTSAPAQISTSPAGSPTQAAIMALHGPRSGPAALRTRDDGAWQGIWEELDSTEKPERTGESAASEEADGEDGSGAAEESGGRGVEPCC